MNFPQLMKSKQKAVVGLTGGIEYLFKKNKVDYLKGWGKFSGENSVAVDLNDGKTDEVSAKHIIIATGSEPAALPKGMLDIDEQYVVTSTGALDLKQVPGSMVVIGGGVIGLEMGSVYARLGTKVDVVEFADSICPTLDREVTTQFSKLLKKQGLNIMTGTKLVSGVNNKDKGVELVVENAKGQQKMKADVVLLCVGRRPFTDGLDLGKAGLEANKFGRVDINDHWQTKKPHIYAIGDVVDGPMLAHKAEEEGIAAVEHILGEGGHVNYGAIPGVIYTHPEVANVGLSEEELKEKGIAYSKGVFPFQANSRARTNDEPDGMVKILSCAKTDKILGAWIIGPNAGEMIHEAVIAIEYGASSEDIARTCHAHPTLAEAFKEACMATHGKPIHF